jgi:hypothetical protein
MTVVIRINCNFLSIFFEKIPIPIPIPLRQTRGAHRATSL